MFFATYTEQKKETSHAYLKYIFSGCEYLQILFYVLREVFTVLIMNVMTEAVKVMSQDQFDVSKGPNL